MLSRDTIPDESTLVQLPPFESGDGSGGGDGEVSSTARIARWTSFLMAILNSWERGSDSARRIGD